MPLGGLVVPCVTLFGEGGRLDLPKNSRFVRGLLDDGVRHVLALGTPGEVSSLDPSEREQLLEKIVESCTFGTDVWAAVSGRTTEDAVAMADNAEAVGAAVLVAFPPTGDTATPPAIVEHFRAIRGQSKLPLLAYRAGPEGFPLPREVLASLASEGVIEGVVDSSGNAEELSAWTSLAPGKLSVFGGDGRGSLEALAKGARGVAWESANVLPRLASRIWDHHEKGQWEKLPPLLALQDLVVQASRVAPRPSALKFLSGYLRETDEGYRPPHGPLTEEQRSQVVALLEPQKAALQEFA